MAERKHTDTRVSLHPLPFEEAVKRLLRVPPPPKEERRPAKERPPSTAVVALANYCT